MQQPQDNKNLLLAIALSVVVMVGWNYFYGVPQAEKTRQQAAQNPAQDPAAQPGAAPAAARVALAAGAAGRCLQPACHSTRAVRPAPRAEALAASPRIAIETPALSGSIALKGGRFDDLSFKSSIARRLTPRANIVLFSPADAEKGYFADLGWVAPAGSAVAAPNAETLWQSSGGKLTPATPVTLTYDNGQGLVFTRKVSGRRQVHVHHTDRVENKSARPVHAVALWPHLARRRAAGHRRHLRAA
jgi:YidC/Oxa1 family membrane protein insertase